MTVGTQKASSQRRPAFQGPRLKRGLNSVQVELPSGKIKEFCQKWKIAEFSLFGSVLRDDFRPDSDVDVLVTFAPSAHWSLFDLAEMEEEMSAIIGHRVDLVERRAIEQSDNYIRRRNILTSAEPVYVAR